MKIVLHTGPLDGSDIHARALGAVGFDVRLLPMVRVEAIATSIQLTKPFDWAVLTSRAAVPWLTACGATFRQLACIGESTARVARDAGLAVDLVGTSGAATLCDLLRIEGACGSVLWPRGADALPIVRDRLAAIGCIVEDPIAYRTLPVAHSESEIREAMSGLAAITVTSPSGVDGLVHALDVIAMRPDDLHIPVISMGPTTLNRSVERGFGFCTSVLQPTATALARGVALALASEMTP